jgi:DNA-binding MarR family transcriptional regulator
MGIEDQVIVALRRITRAIDLHSRTLVEKHGLTVPQLAALQAVGKLRGTTISGVAEAIHLSAATVTGILNRLERRGLVKRCRDGRDRRNVVVELTDGGAELLSAAPSLLQDRFRRGLGSLRLWEQTQLLASLQRIAAMMDAESIEADPTLAPETVTASAEDVSAYLDRVGEQFEQRKSYDSLTILPEDSRPETVN